MACINDVHQLDSVEMEENIYRSSDDMSRKLLPHHPDVMKLYLEVLSASVQIIKASKPPVPPVHSVVNSFHNLLYSALDQAHILSEILYLPIMDLFVRSQVDMMLMQGLTVVAREAGSLFISTSKHAVVSNLLHKLNHIKGQLFVLELHNYKAQAIILVLADSSTSCLKFLGEFRIENLKVSNDSTICGTSESKAASSITRLLNKFQDFLDHRLRSSVQHTHSSSTIKAIKFVKTFLYYYDANWSGLDEAEHFAYLCEGTRTYFRWLERDIAKVFECKDHRHLDSAILQSFVTVDLLCINNIGEMYDELARLSHPTLFVDKFADVVQQYLMNDPKIPLGCELVDYSSAVKSFKVTVERLKLFRCLVSSFSKQCSERKKLHALLDRSAAMVFCILHMAHANSVSHIHGGEVEEKLFSSYDMSAKAFISESGCYGGVF